MLDCYYMSKQAAGFLAGFLVLVGAALYIQDWIGGGGEVALVGGLSTEAGPNLSPQHVISMTREGFGPSEIEIRRGDIVQWVNNDSVDHWPASDLHPTHGIYPEFDPQQPIPPGASWSFKFEKSGTWRMHDHLKPLWRGLVHVTQ